MALGRFGVLRRFLRSAAILRQPSSGGLTVDWTTALALIVAVGLAVFLTVALLKPEKFS
jgi:K+-transporting ATPase KdpF subunit